MPYEHGHINVLDISHFTAAYLRPGHGRGVLNRLFTRERETIAGRRPSCDAFQIVCQSTKADELQAERYMNLNDAKPTHARQMPVKGTVLRPAAAAAAAPCQAPCQ